MTYATLDAGAENCGRLIGLKVCRTRRGWSG